ncbi:peptidyl-trna hydrolase [Botrytis cinerea]
MTQPDRVRAQKKLSTNEGGKDLDASRESQPQSKSQSKSQPQPQLQLPTPPSSSTPTPSRSPSPSPSPSPPPPPSTQTQTQTQTPTPTRKQKRRALLAESLALSLHTSSFPDSNPESDVPSSTTIQLSPYHLTPNMATPRASSSAPSATPPPTPTRCTQPDTQSSLSSRPRSRTRPSKNRARTETREASSADCKLVVIHDELELPAGRINVKPGSNSPKGHNGLKSIRDTLRGQPYTRIGVGIGRPESRDAGVVANYVLRKMSAEEKRKIEGCVGKVLEELARLSGE